MDKSKTYPKLAPTSINNSKVGDALIFNLTSATACNSAQQGLCEVCNQGIECYALKAEKLYKGCLPFRTRQTEYFDSKTPQEISFDFLSIIAKYDLPKVRWQEAGDFRNQGDVNKLAKISKNIPTKQATFTANPTLNLKALKKTCKVRISGHKIPGELYTRVIKSSYRGTSKVRKHKEWLATAKLVNRNNFNEYLCPGSCIKCQACWNTDYNIVFLSH